jgi:preprotein translocase subunit SecF
MSNYAEVDNSSTLMNNLLQTDLVKKNEDDKEVRLTHKDCILLYTNPNIGSSKKYNHAIKHIKNCKTCKNEISKNNKKYENYNTAEKNDIQIIKPSETQYPVYQQPSEPEYKKIIQEEKNVQHQNILIENTIAKYFDTIEEKKKLNENIEKIRETLSKTNNDKPILYCLLIFLIILVLIDIILRIQIR